VAGKLSSCFVTLSFGARVETAKGVVDLPGVVANQIACEPRTRDEPASYFLLLFLVVDFLADDFLVVDFFAAFLAAMALGTSFLLRNVKLRNFPVNDFLLA
jgi:hypothetical protein